MLGWLIRNFVLDTLTTMWCDSLMWLQSTSVQLFCHKRICKVCFVILSTYTQQITKQQQQAKNISISMLVFIYKIFLYFTLLETKWSVRKYICENCLISLFYSQVKMKWDHENERNSVTNVHILVGCVTLYVGR